MASNTENLNLLMKNPSTDGADTFNIQTMLNENWQKIDNNAGTVAQTLANILKPTTPPIIGLPPSTTPDGMFQALGNTGELHVWRKNVTQDNAVDASYTVDDVTVDRCYTGDQTLPSPALICWGRNGVAITVANSFTLNPTTNLITLSNSVNYSYENDAFPSSDVLVGKYVYLKYPSTYGPANLNQSLLYYIPNDASITRINDWIYCNKLQYVNVTPYVPAGTTTTYPVSTNPNAYQEGDDAKPAGYTLGEVVTGTISVCPSTSSEEGWRYTSNQGSIVVSDAGEVSMSGNDTSMLYANSVSASPFDVLRGKYVKCPKINADLSDRIVYFPIDAVFSLERDSPFRIIVNKYQPVTGYAAIPAGNTIEYLGKLGDKARMQVVSYVGTGTYGSDHPNSLTFNFVPKVVIVNGHRVTASYTNSYSIILSPQSGDGVSMLGSDSGNYVYLVICKATDRTVSWYARDYEKQLNKSDMKYVAVAIG